MELLLAQNGAAGSAQDEKATLHGVPEIAAASGEQADTPRIAEVAKDALLAFVATAFEGGRHASRVEKLALLDGIRPCAAT